jgi:hypothetical protein
MTHQKLGEMSTHEIWEAWYGSGDRLLAAERWERSAASKSGAPGKHAALSREQVRAFAPTQMPMAGGTNKRHVVAYEAGFNDGVEAFARALLALPPDAPSPLG